MRLVPSIPRQSLDSSELWCAWPGRLSPGITPCCPPWFLYPGTVAIDQRLLESAFERFNTLKKKEGINQLRVALEEMGLRLSLKELATALTTLGLTWGRPTQRQVRKMTEAFDQFGQLHELYGEDEAIGMVAGMLGFKSTAAARKQIVEAGHLEARKRAKL
ncbi:hypothetical protein Vretifemale_10272 [Volvox reticuliferus]|uniref:Uncharacterized protein n=1 Tax=Volvox reticuliferus TaxID=1737510 RepID=A0A8J4CHP3_9CHLO|nr:hypothetical protein Vretifemale_10272 [Volvox reticuliferus]